jgi:hypothetical protein
MANDVTERQDRSAAPFLLAVAIVIIGLLVIWLSGGFHHAVHHQEYTNAPAATWSDFSSGTGTEGPKLEGQMALHVSCRVAGHKFASDDGWWYRIAASPWNNKFYAPAHAFYNDGRISGVEQHPTLLDRDVPTC